MCDKEIEELLQKGLIRESTSEWACFGFYVNKHSEIVRGKPRLVINYKPLNDALAYMLILFLSLLLSWPK